MGNCSCAACDQACPAPPVDASIGFFDGFDGALVAIVYGALIVFSIIYQVLKNTVLKKYYQNNDDNELDEPFDNQNNAEGEDNPYLRKQQQLGANKDKINNSEISSFANNSQLLGAGGNLRGVDTAQSNRNPLDNN